MPSITKSGDPGSHTVLAGSAGFGVGLDWIIAGGESDPGARPAHPDWFRSLRDQCAAAGVPFFFKQWGEWAPRVVPWDVDLEASIAAGRLAPPWAEAGQQWAMARVGRKRAGAELDGRHHHEWPEGLAA